MPRYRSQHVTRSRAASLTAVFAVLLSLVGGFAVPAGASTPVLPADTLPSGAGYAFGANGSGQVKPGVTVNQTTPVQLPGGASQFLKDAVSVAVGQNFTIWADRKGRVWSIGDDSNGQGGNGSQAAGTTNTTPVQAFCFGGAGGCPNGVSGAKAVKVTAYGLGVDVLDDTGRVWQWGQVVNNNKDLATQATPALLTFPFPTPVAAGTQIIDIASGNTFALAMDNLFRVYSWGKNDRGQLGLNSTSSSPQPSLVTGLPVPTSTDGKVGTIEAGKDFATFTIGSGSTLATGGIDIWTWGANNLSQTGNNKTTDVKAPNKVASLAVPNGGTQLKVLSLSSGASHTLLLTNDGVLRIWGSNGIGAYPVPTVYSHPSITGQNHPYLVAAGDGDSLVANTNGTVVGWGTDTTGQLGQGATGTVTTPVSVSIPGLTPITLTGPPVLLVSRNGTTAAIIDPEIARSGEANPYLFGGADMAGPYPTHTFTLSNTASKPLTLSQALYVDGANPADFQPSGSTCTAGRVLGLDDTCTVTVTFHPTAAGSRQASLVLRTTATLGGVLESSFVPMVGNGQSQSPGLSSFTVDLENPPSTLPGRGNRIPLSSLSPDLIPKAVPATGASATIGRTQLLPTIGRITIGRTQLLPTIGRITIGRTATGNITIGRTTIGRTTIGRTGLSAAQLLPTIGRITIGRTPLMTLGGWTEFLKDYPALANQPASSVTYAQLFAQPANANVAAPQDRITLGDIDWSNSIIAQASFLGLLMGQTRLSQYPVDWCDELAPFETPANCTGAGLDRTLFSLSLANGYPLDSFKATGLLVGQITPLVAGDDPWKDSVWSQILLRSVTLPGTHIGAIPLTSIPTANLQRVVDCTATDCTAAGRTLADVVPFIKTDAVFGDLGAALNTIEVAQLAEPFLDRGSFPWEALPRDLIPLQAYPNRLTVKADADVNCTKMSGTQVQLTLPTGYDYVPSTAVLTKTNGTGTVLEPATFDKASRTVTVSLPDSTFGGSGPLTCSTSSATLNAAHVTLRVGVLPGNAQQTNPTPVHGVFTSGTLSATADAAHSVNLTGLYDPPGTSPNGPPGASDELILGTLGTPGQVQYVPFDAAPGKVVEASLSQLSSDLDLVLYHPQGAPLDPVLAPSTSTEPVPFGEAPYTQADPRYTPGQAIGGALQDVPIASNQLGRPVAAVSALRSTDDEQLSTVARAGTGANPNRYLLQISGFNGATSSYTVRIRVSDPQTLGQCTVTPPTVTYPTTASTFYSPGGSVSGFNGDDDTVVLVNPSRMDALYGSGSGQSVLTAAYNLTHGGGVKGQVVRLDASAATDLRAKYQAWDTAQSYCDPDASNAVVKAIDDFVYGLLPAQVKYVVLLGGHEAGAPHALMIDTTRDGNEREEAGDLAFTGNNPLANALALGRYPTDTPYGTKHPLSVLGQVVYVPELSVGRVAGEDPATIVAQLNAFTTAGGLADPPSASKTATVTDYDFLTGGGTNVASALSSGGWSTTHDLTGATARWTKSQLDAEWLNRSPAPPAVGVLNMHYDQYRALPALGNATNSTTDLYTADQVASSSTLLTQRVVLTVGCHSALDVPDRWTDASTALRGKDWAQRYAEKGLAVYVGNLGFGYADSSVVAYSALEQQYLAEAMAQKRDMGFSLVQAQQTYVRNLTSLSPYDLKSIQQMVLWGLPQYRTSAAAQAMAATAAPAPAPLGTDPATGGLSRPMDVGTASAPIQFRTVTDSGGSTHLESSLDGQSWGTSAVSGLPILGRVTVPVPEEPGYAVRSVVPDALTVAPAQAATVTFARAGTDTGQPQQPLNEGDFPATMSHLWTIPGVDGSDTSLVLNPEQVHLDGTAPGHAQVSTFPTGRYRVLYGTPGEPVVQDTFTRVDAVTVPAASGNPAVTSYTVQITPAPGTTTKDVYVMALPESGSGALVKVQLSPSGNPNEFVGGSTGALGRFFVVSINDKLFSSFSTLKGGGWFPHIVTNGGDLSGISITPTAGTTGWRTTQTTATCAAGWTLYVDGAQVACPYTFSNGAHVVTAKGPDGQFVQIGGQQAFVTVLVDTVSPSIALGFPGTATSYPADGDRLHVELRATQPVTEAVTCGPSGCTSTDNGIAVGAGRGLSTSTVGAQSFTASVTNGAGVTASSTRAYRVVFGAASGFTNGGTGQLVVPILPVRFTYRLTDASGSTAGPGFSAGSTYSLTSSSTCGSGGTFTLPSGLFPAAAPTYNSSTGNYEWDLAASLLSGCQRLDIALPDGWTHLYENVQSLV